MAMWARNSVNLDFTTSASTTYNALGVTSCVHARSGDAEAVCELCLAVALNCHALHVQECCQNPKMSNSIVDARVVVMAQSAHGRFIPGNVEARVLCLCFLVS